MRKRFRVLGVLALVLALVMPSSAFAWDLVGDGPWWRGNTSQGMYGACVHAGNKFDAAAWLFSRGDPAMLSSEVRTKLSDPNYGGRFYEYAQTFSHMDDLTQYPEWLPAYVGVANLFANGFVLGITNVGFYTSNVSESLYYGAKTDFERVLAGEDLYEPEPVTPVSSDYYVFSGNAWLANNDHYTLKKYYFNGNGGTQYSLNMKMYTHVRNPISVRVPASALENLNSVCPAGTVPWYIEVNIYQGGISSVNVFASQYFSVTNNSYTENGVSYPCINQVSKPNSNPVYSSSLGTSYQFDGSTLTFSQTSPASLSTSTSSQFGVNSGTSRFVLAFDSGSLPAAPVVPPPSGTWPEPETPVTPTAPEIPTPTAPTTTTDPVVVDPTVVWPEITVNVQPTSEGLDYTALLTAINNNLNSLRSDLNQEFDSVITGLRNIYQYLQHLDDLLERHCKHLRDALDDGIYNLELYIKSLFEWLPRQLDFDANFDYDDSGIKSYLQRILNKIPGGSTGAPTSYMPNPQSDEPGFFDWLLDLWHRFLIDLVSVLPDELGGLVDAFSQLTHYFPFSIPWDLAALLALFEHEPVTPVFDVPWGFGGDEGEIEMVRVDLSAWDGVMEMVRPVFVVGFCWQLAMITKELLGNFDINKGGV